MHTSRPEAEALNWLLSSVADAMLIVDSQGAIVLANAPAERLFKAEPGSLLGKSIESVLPERFRERHKSQRDDYFAHLHMQLAGIALDTVAQRCTGEEFPAEVSLSPLHTACGTPLVLATVRDITARKLAQDAQRDSEARLRAIIDNAHDAIITVDENQLIEHVNPPTVRMFGYEESELIGREVTILMPPRERERHDQYVAYYRRTGDARSISGFEQLGRRKDGSTFAIDVSISAMRIGERRMFTGIVRDISKRRQAEARFRTLVEQIQAITYVSQRQDPQHFEYVSPQIEALGFSPDAWISQPGLLRQRIHADDRKHACVALSLRAATGRPGRLEYRLVTPQGETLWFRDEARPVLDDSGQSLFMQGLLVDITQDKLNEEMLRQSREAMRSFAAHQETIKENERKRIAQEIHDELGSLLTGIKAHVSVSIDRTMQAGGPPDPLLADAAHLTDEAMGAVRRVITDLRPSVLDQLGIWEAISWYTGQVDKHPDLSCGSTIEDGIEDTELDPELSITVFRIVQEALTNVQRHAGATHALVRAWRRTDTLNIEISDNGHGFEPNRLAERTCWGILGMRERAQYFGGKLDIDSQPGTGTRILLILPIAPEPFDVNPADHDI
jgi:two-component system, NarL family, sensor histidine kinase UhpB